MKILYITKLKNSYANGVTVSVTQKLNNMCNYANVFWLNLSDNLFELDDRVVRVSFDNYLHIKPDIAVFEDPFNSVSFCTIARNLRKNAIPYIITPHGCFNKNALKKGKIKKIVAINTIFRTFFKKSIATHFVSNGEKENSIFNSNPIVIPNGIIFQSSWRIRTKITKIIFIGRKDVITKGIDLLLEATKSIKSFLMNNKIELHLYGPKHSEDDYNYINNYILKNQLSDVVFNNDAVYGDQKKDVLNGADLFVLSSRNEGFPMSVLEALQCGLPVLVTRGTNIDDVIEASHSGWVADNSVNGIAQALTEAVLCSDIKNRSANALNLSKDYLWSNICKQTVVKYSTILERQR